MGGDALRVLNLMSSVNTSQRVEAADPDIRVQDLGRMAYNDAFNLQRRLQRELIEQRREQSPAGTIHVLLVEHDPPVITVSRRKSAAGHLLATDQQLQAAGVEVAETDRGGDITYHGPGQLVVYPILDLNLLGLRLHGYMRFLEDLIIDVLGRWGIGGVRDECATGVWVNQRGGAPPSRSTCESNDTLNTAKICAMGVRVSRWVTMHGLALNVTTNLDHFNLIVPCGLHGRTVTSMQQVLAEDCPSMDDVKDALIQSFETSVHECLSNSSNGAT